MSVVPYIITVLAFAALYFSDNNPDNEMYAGLLCLSLAVTGVVHWLMMRHRCYTTEYLGGIVMELFHEDSWTEIIIREEREPCGKDSYGNVEYRTVRRKDYVYHPAIWRMITSNGSSIDIEKSEFYNIVDVWQTPKHPFSITGDEIQGGIRFGKRYRFSDVTEELEENGENPLFNEALRKRTYTVTETHKYKNKIRNSNSIFKFEDIKEEEAITLGLHDYPTICDDYDQSPVIGVSGNAIGGEIDELYRTFNAYYGSIYEIHVFVLLFDASKGVETAQKQQAYWKGGNKNEFVVCLGITDDEVKWCYTFSWMDEPTLGVKTEGYFRENTKLDLKSYLYWLIDNINYWKRKEFADFDYITVNLTTAQIIWLTLITIVVNVLLMYYVLIPDIKKDSSKEMIENEYYYENIY